YAFAGIAIIGGIQVVTQRNPVHAALSFALVVLATCGLFLLQAAPFLFAATMIIYAGAIVVTFLFVIMLAQQEGYSSADARSREPEASVLVSDHATPRRAGSRQGPESPPPEKLPASNVAALGRSLFTDYLIPVEIAGVILMVATIGAICIAGRRPEVNP